MNSMRSAFWQAARAFCGMAPFTSSGDGGRPDKLLLNGKIDGARKRLLHDLHKLTAFFVVFNALFLLHSGKRRLAKR